MKQIYPNFKMNCVGGKLIPMPGDQFERYLMTLPDEVNVLVTPYKKYTLRSNSQNRYLHGYLFQEIADHLGYTPEEVKEIMKSKFLKEWKTVKTTHGDVEVEYIRPTSSLNTIELEDFVRKIREFASIEFSLYLALPNEVEGY